MKKLILSVFFSLAYIASASADLGVNVGVSGQAGLFAGSATESNPVASKTKGNANEYGEAAWGSVFVEGTFGDRFMVGVDYVPAALETDTTETAKGDKRTASVETITQTSNKVTVDFEHLTTVYAGIMINENFYAKAGYVTVDVLTREDLGTGGSYGDTELDGTMFGLGYHNALDNGVFFRFEGNYIDFDGASQTNSNNANRKIELTSLDGITGKISLGKTF
tara:strand:- start:571 stop:1236 length:666 start_codon:yes stop_codon:yes gene_type:complete